MSEWESLSVRTGQREKFNMIDGFPKFLQLQVRDSTLEAVNAIQGLVRAIAVKLRVEITDDQYRADAHLWARMCEDEVLALDVYDFLADINQRVNPRQLDSELRDIEAWFSLAGSSWRFNLKDGRLEHRLPQSALDSYGLATSAEDLVSEYLSKAWSHSFGRDKDAIAAWSEATRALEQTFKPIVSPKNAGATWGTIKKNVEAKPSKWDASMPGSDRGERVANLLTIMKQHHYSPKRHGGDERDAPTLEVSRSVVLLATSLIAIVREGGFWRVEEQPTS